MPRGEAEDRLALLEALVLCDEIAESSEHALAWLSGRPGVRAALCMALSLDGARLTSVASAGCRAGQFAIDLADAGHPLVALLNHGRPRRLQDPVGERHLHTPLGRGALDALPLRDRQSKEPVGLLLVAGRTEGPSADLQWLAGVLGARLHELRERRFARDRTLLQTVANAVSDPILLTDTEGRIIVSNVRADALFASRDGETEGRSRAVALNNMLFSAALSRTAFDDQEPSRRELLLVDPTEGSDLLFELLSTVVDRGRDGHGVVSVLRNVTDLRRATEEIEENYARVRAAEAEARAERDRLNLIIDSVVDPILVTDPAGNIVLMNQHAEHLFTVGVGSQGEDTRRAIRLNDAVFSSFASNLYAGQQLRWRGEMVLVDPARGVQLPMEAISGKVLSDHGEVSAVVTILHDRTEALEKARLYEQVKRASAELEQKVRSATAELAEQNELLRRQHLQLEQASALKSQFLANVSHELRTPLNAILGYASMLGMGVSGEITPPQRRSLQRIESNGRHLLALIDNLLDIERIESGKMPLHATEFALPGLVAEVLAELEPLADRSGLVVSSDVPSVLPPMLSDRQKVKQILVNLVANAIKFTPKGAVRLRARYTRATDRLTVSVIDTGVGIAPRDHERVFDVFQQADASTTRPFGGTGLGLAICRRLAGMLGGRITLQSELGKGSTFTVTLPRKVRAT